MSIHRFPPNSSTRRRVRQARSRMKRPALFVLSAAIALLLALGAHAQVTQRWSANVLFAFIVKDKTIAAGLAAHNSHFRRPLRLVQIDLSS